MPDLIQCDVVDDVAVVKLDNPPLNLVTMELTRQLADVLERTRGDRSIAALVLTGSGAKAFCAGSDVKEFPDLIDEQQFVARKLAFENETFSLVDSFPCPTIAALNGLAFGGGLEMAVCCDLIVAEENARFALPEIKLGGIPGSGGTFRLARRIGEGRAKEMALLGEPIDAATALRWGLVNRLVAAGAVLPEALRLARVFARGPHAALRACKRCVDEAFDLPEEEARRRVLERSHDVFRSDECREGVRAFLARETHPNFPRS